MVSAPAVLNMSVRHGRVAKTGASEQRLDGSCIDQTGPIQIGTLQIYVAEVGPLQMSFL